MQLCPLFNLSKLPCATHMVQGNCSMVKHMYRLIFGNSIFFIIIFSFPSYLKERKKIGSSVSKTSTPGFRIYRAV